MRRRLAGLAIWPALLIALAPTGCDDGAEPAIVLDPTTDGAPPDGERPDAGDVDGAPDPRADAAADPRPLDACARTAGAVSDGRPAPLQWSAAHALARFFGAHAGTAASDEALVTAWADDGVGDRQAYADALDHVCAVPGTASNLGPARVDALDDGVRIRPGTGPVAMPDDAAFVVLDLTDLPADPALPAALDAVAEAIAPAPVHQTFEIRVVEGLPDEVYTPQSVYRTVIGAVDVQWPGAADRQRPLAVLLGSQTPPAAARLAGALRMSDRAWLVGEPLFAAIAESDVVPVGDGGLAIRWGTALDDGGAPWPDRIDPDAQTLAEWRAGLADPVVPARPDGPADRARAQPYVPYEQAPPAEPGPAARRAMLIVAHGALRRFFPYFDVVGDGLDARVLETWATLDDDWTRADSVDLLHRLGEVIQDGHAFVFDFRGGGGSAPIAVDHLVDGQPVVRASRSLAVRAGQIITAIDGVPAAEWYADELTRTSAATRGYALDLASRRYLQGSGPLRLELVDPAGVESGVELARGAFAEVPSATPWSHPTGWLDAFDAAGVFYVNLANDVEADEPDLIARMQAALPEAEALIIDMRGYPGLRTDRVALLTIGGTWRSAVFDVPTWLGPHASEIRSSQYDARGVGGREAAELAPFAGPVALLVGPTSVSAAENFAMTISRADGVTVVGRRSAATNGNITGVDLPGGFGFTFTGMRVLFPDGALFHGVGIAPDIEVHPTAAALAEGRDEGLGAAIEHVLR